MLLGAAALAAVPMDRSLAADFPVKAAAPVLYNWSGCYGGINGGLGASSADYRSTVDPGTHLLGGDPALVGSAGAGGFNGDSFAGGVQVGCNQQSGTVVWGLEGDVDFLRSKPQLSNATNTLTDGVTPFTLNQSITSNYIATLRPRIGIAADRNLAYITGGAALTSVNYIQSYSDVPTPGGAIGSAGAGLASASRTLVGWAAGAGWEHAWTDHATFRVEYIYASFPGASALGAITDTAGGVNTLHGTATLTIQLARVGLNYKF